MAREPSSPLSREDIAECRNALGWCGSARELIAKAEACGYDCRAHRAVEQALTERLSAVLNNFGGGRVKE